MKILLIITALSLLLTLAPSQTIDGVECFCVAEGTGHNGCPGLWELWRCFPDWPAPLPMEYVVTCDGLRGWQLYYLPIAIQEGTVLGTPPMPPGG